jgi:hypothetical protein
MSKRSSPLPPKRPPSPALTYAEWRAQARAKLAGPNLMRERDWRNLYIKSKSPDEAAAEAETYYRNSQARGRR